MMKDRLSSRVLRLLLLLVVAALLLGVSQAFLFPVPSPSPSAMAGGPRSPPAAVALTPKVRTHEHMYATKPNC